MIWFLRICFGTVLITMLCMATWASSAVALWNTPRAGAKLKALLLREK